MLRDTCEIFVRTYENSGSLHSSEFHTLKTLHLAQYAHDRRNWNWWILSLYVLSALIEKSAKILYTNI